MPAHKNLSPKEKKKAEIALIELMYEMADRKAAKSKAEAYAQMSMEGEELTVAIMRMLSILPHQKKVEQLLSVALNIITLSIATKG